MIREHPWHVHCHMTRDSQQERLNILRLLSVTNTPRNTYKDIQVETCSFYLLILQCADEKLTCGMPVTYTYINFPTNLGPMSSIPLSQYLPISQSFLLSSENVSKKSDFFKVFSNTAFRNSAYVLYIAKPAQQNHQEEHKKLERRSARTSVKLYKRCLYCNEGTVGMKLLEYNGWNQSMDDQDKSYLFPDQFHDFYGYLLKMVALTWAPLIIVTADDPENPNIATPVDSLDVRTINAMSKLMNFTYRIVQQADGWSSQQDADGNFKGRIGALQRNEVDLTPFITAQPERMSVMDFSRIYTYEPLMIISAKPGQLPNYLSIIRPFTGLIWIGILITTAIFILLFWYGQMLWSWISGYKGETLTETIFMTLGIILEDVQPRQPENIFAQLLIGIWLLFCFIIQNAYRASLLGILAVPTFFKPMESLEMLVNNQVHIIVLVHK
ncbi:unnamed protein product [Meganyctiphanes norvegica]|uniref:Ionotropic glutamate receptor C-terminal domain-containing protein n=1 Tax=Meganyctiphanes norvegica TaxID=48144 RepID=A0AAV2SFQ1_MEGNR